MNKSQANASHKAYELYWKILGMATQLENNELPEKAKAWRKASEVLAPAVADEVKKVEEANKRKLASLMKPADRLAELEAENERLRAKSK